jgi:hypothetical protein
MHTFGMTYSRDITAISELAGEAVSTWSEQWWIEIEARAVLKLSKQERDVFFNGKKDRNGKTIDRGIGRNPRPKATEAIMETMRQLQDARHLRNRRQLSG